MIPATPKIALFLGTTYTGKSWAAGWFAAHINRPFVIIVHTHPDRSYLSHIQHTEASFIAVHRERYTVTPEFLRSMRAKGRYLWLSVYDLSLEQTQKFLLSLVRSIESVGDLSLFIDEAHLFCSRFQAPTRLIGFIRGARFYGADVILVSHRLRDIDVGIRCVLTDLVVFRTVEPSDLDVLSDELGLRDMEDRIRSLPDRMFIYVDRREGKVSEPTSFL